MASDVTILIVDDNPVNLAALRHLLGAKGDFNVLEATNGTEALAQVQGASDLDLILLDVQLPDLSGIEVCRKLKQDKTKSQIPIVLISGVRTDDASLAEGLEAGADGYLTRPIESVAIQAWLNATLRISALQHELERKAPAPLKDEAELLSYFSKLSHDVNNPLQSLIATADLLSLRVDGDEVSEAYLQSIQDYAEKVAAKVAQASKGAKNRLTQIL
jgi:CheY-like chemotaxis protein